MRHWAFMVVAALASPASSIAQPVGAAAQSPFTYEKIMVPMRDGARLETVVIRPRVAAGPLPILLMRSPYGVPQAAPAVAPRGYGELAKDGYIFVYQNMRGRYGSDGRFAASTDLSKPIDDATDAWDAIDWLVKRVPGNNGRVGMTGVSYPGLAAAIALAEPHPALKAVSPQAAWADWWLNDDLHRHGALRLSYAADWLYSLQAGKGDAEIEFYDRHDMYDWFLALGPVENLDKRYFKGSIPAFTALLDHPDYDAYWKAERWIDRLGAAKVPTLHVIGFWDQEDPWGSWAIYRKLEAADPEGLNSVVAGPWTHGSWRGAGDAVGPIPIGRATGPEFREQIEAPFFRHWLHGKGERPRFEARILQSGSWTWKSYPSWPPKIARPTNLYLHANGTLSFTPPAAGAGPGWREYISDPANPVPYRPRPISPTYPCGEWCWWEAMDQRFVHGRPDVLSYVSAPLEADLTVTGDVAAMIHAATSGTDADIVVKLIDVFPENAETLDGKARASGWRQSLNGYQWPIAMEIRRGRWLDSNERPAPLTPNKPVAWRVDLRDRDHVFKRGHRVMVQIQSSWFPVIDRNPQRFVPNIARARPEDFRPATQRVFSTPQLPSHVVLPVVR